MVLVEYGVQMKQFGFGTCSIKSVSPRLGNMFLVLFILKVCRAGKQK